jgi:hypothetical protein
MSGRGVHFALSNAQTEAVLAAKDDDNLMSVIEAIEAEWNKAYLAESDKAWNAIHGCLMDGNLLYEGGQYPLNHCICGSQQLHNEEDYTVSFSFVFCSASEKSKFEIKYPGSNSRASGVAQS